MTKWQYFPEIYGRVGVGFKLTYNMRTLQQQECIPVGCVPSAAVAVSRGGGCICPVGCTWSRGGAPGPGGGGAPGQALPPCGQTHACKNITFATSLRTVMIRMKANTKLSTRLDACSLCMCTMTCSVVYFGGWELLFQS